MCISNVAQSLRFQPIYSVGNEDIIGYEVLSWLNNGDNCDGFFSSLCAADYLSIIEYQLRAISLEDKRVRHFVNVPVAVLIDNHSVDAILLMLSQNVVIELQDSESLLVLSNHEQQLLKNNMVRIRQFGCELWLDDLTTGLMSVVVQLGFEFSGIKIDKNAFWQQEHHPEILTSFILCCHFMSNNVLVEGIETLEQYQLAIQCGADYLQGFYWSELLKSSIH